MSATKLGSKLKHYRYVVRFKCRCPVTHWQSTLSTWHSW